jgi:hypothetical protein
MRASDAQRARQSFRIADAARGRRIDMRAEIAVTETFSVDVDDMARAIAFYVGAFGATVTFASPAWSPQSIPARSR